MRNLEHLRSGHSDSGSSPQHTGAGSFIRPEGQLIRNERGVVIVDFIFSIVIVAGLSVLLFSLTYTLAVFEVTQYVVFSAARAHAASNKDPDAQKAAAIAKFKQLTTGKGAIASLYSGTWYQLVKPDALDVRGGATADGKNFSTDLAGGSDMPNRNWFLGVSAQLTANILSLKLPLLGNTSEDDASFKTRLNVMMIREPSQKECKDFLEKRRDALATLPSAQTYYQQSGYVPMEDNGC